MEPIDIKSEEEIQLKIIAEAYYERCLIAERDFRYFDMFDHIIKAIEISYPDNQKYEEKIEELKKKYPQPYEWYV